jgi:tRNA pseudouridine38-40 synthase
MARFRLLVEYDGTPYVGWQRQANGHSVQAAIERAIKKFSGDIVTVFGAGRTDTGVHAYGQVAHIDLERDWPADVVRNAVNAFLVDYDERVVIVDVTKVDTRFDARFSAIRRHYLYKIRSRRAPLALDYTRAWYIPKDMDHEIMHEAAQRLIGHHDFTTFRSAKCQAKNPVRTMERVDVSRVGDQIEIRASAQSFLHNQIRSFAGTLAMVGLGKWTPQDVTDALEAKDRTRCGPVAPPHGLYFMSVEYKPMESMPDVETDQTIPTPR